MICFQSQLGRAADPVAARARRGLLDSKDRIQVDHFWR